MNRRPPVLAALIACLALLIHAKPVMAVDYCVGDTAELLAALESAADSTVNDVIRLERGDYPLVANVAEFSIKGDLVIRGGYASGCPLLGRSLDPRLTRIFGAGTLFPGITLGVNDSLEIDGLAFEHTSGVRLLSAGSQTQTPQPITVRRSRFSNNIMGLEVRSTHHDVRIENNLILDSIGFEGNRHDGLAVVHDAPSSASISVDVLFNTVLGNARAFLIKGGGPFASAPRVQNNILRSDASGTVDMAYALFIERVQIAATNNVWGVRVFSNGGGLTTDLLNVFADPQLDANLIPIAGSPALNSGTEFVAGGAPATDHDGGPRTVGSLPDRGALESAISDIDTLFVTSTANSGAGTLRQAIIDSNQTLNAERIEFNLGPASGCPYAISLTSPLPAVTSPLTIDGFSQAGSSANTRDDSYDGVHCVVLSGSVSQGLRLQPAAGQVITVMGLAFQRFTSAAIEADGAGSVRIWGNTFGVLTNPLVPAGFLGDAIAINGTVGTYIGGAGAVRVNLIGNADGAGVRLTDCDGCSVRGNLIGVRADGHSELGNGVGVLAVGGDGAIADNVIGHSATQGLRVEGATASYNVSFNRIGEARALIPPFDLPYEIPNGGNGIRLVGGSGHVVTKNTIAHNATDGVVVLDAVDRARLGQNAIYGNGQLGIDLSPDGVDPQDTDLIDAGGGNGGQNFPVLLDASGSDTQGTVSGELYSRSGQFQIELFASQSCDGSSHGEGTRWLRSFPLSISATTPGGLPFEDTVPFSVEVESSSGLLGRFITATATRLVGDEGATSEFSACIEYLQGPEVFRDGFED